VTPFLEAERAVLAYPGRAAPAVADVSFAASPGELVALLGPNGSGKSSLLRMLAGILAPTAGRVLLDGKPAHARPRDEAARLAAYVPQQASVTFDVTGLEVALMGRHPFGRGLLLERDEDVKRAEEALAAAGALPFRDRPFLSLSGGEKQRVVLARAMAQGAPALLLDEPTSAQDLSNALEVFALARNLAHERGKLVLAATHDVNAAARFADRVLILQGGRVAREGKPALALTEDVLRTVFQVEPFVGKTPHGDPFFVALEGRPVAAGPPMNRGTSGAEPPSIGAEPLR
jgi:iron complex transport system ATP-binding protein